MNAVTEDLLQETTRLSSEVTRPFPASRKVYVAGSREDMRVGMREIEQQDTPAMFGVEKNPPVLLYDNSGPYTDPAARIDLVHGLQALRANWIAERNDTLAMSGPSSALRAWQMRGPGIYVSVTNVRRARPSRAPT